MDKHKEERNRGVIIACHTGESSADKWNCIWLDMLANPEKEEPLPIVTCEHVDSGKCTTTGRLVFELGGIPERKLDKSTQDVEYLEKSSLVCTFYMDRQKA